jgi:hypothetical protein
MMYRISRSTAAGSSGSTTTELWTAEPRVAPREQQLHALLVDQSAFLQERQDVVPKHFLRRARVRVRDRNPRAVPPPPAAARERVHMRMEVHPLTEGLHHRHHPRSDLLACARHEHLPHGVPGRPAEIA